MIYDHLCVIGLKLDVYLRSKRTIYHVMYVPASKRTNERTGNRSNMQTTARKVCRSSKFKLSHIQKFSYNVIFDLVLTSFPNKLGLVEIVIISVHE